MLLRNGSRRSLSGAQTDVTKPEAKMPDVAKPGVATRRRALGDITNADTSEESKDKENAAGKKPRSCNVVHAPTNHINVAEDSSISRTRSLRRQSEPQVDAIKHEIKVSGKCQPDVVNTLEDSKSIAAAKRPRCSGSLEISEDSLISRTTSRRRSSGVHPDITKPEAKISGASTKKQALGDVTDTVTAIVSQDSSIIKLTSDIVTHAPTICIEASKISVEVKTEKVIHDVLFRDYMGRDTDDIDSRDKCNPFLATCYIPEMYANFGVLEKQYAVNPKYLADQPYINERMRCILIDWLVRLQLCIFVFHSELYLIKITYLTNANNI
jgi:hypothetical protein